MIRTLRARAASISSRTIRPQHLAVGGPARTQPAQAAAGYLDAQVELAVMARLAQDAGLAVTELHTSWLDTPPEEVVIEARVEAPGGGALRAGQRRGQQDPGRAAQQRLRPGPAHRRCRGPRP
jgi:hypothetical protein